MKIRTAFFACSLILIMFFTGSCKQGSDNPNAFIMDKDASYAIGMYLAQQWQIPDVYYDYPSLMEGFRAVNEMKQTKFSMDVAYEKINEAFEKWAALQGYPTGNGGQDDYYQEMGLMFLAENGQRAGVTTTWTGLQYEVITEGTGARPASTDTVRVHYEGTLIDGTVFDSSYQRGEPIEFPLNGVIPGWTEGLQLMTEGSTYLLFIPSDLGYGPYSAGSIPPNSTLIFRVELIAVVK